MGQAGDTIRLRFAERLQGDTALYTDNPTSGRHPAVYTFAVKFDQYYSTFYQSSTTQRLANPDDRAADSIRSMYSFKMDNGIVLSFDTYNGFFHINADQSQYFSGDLQGDFEFCLERYSENEDTIFGHGKTKLLPFVMIKMPCKAPEYQVRTDSIQNYFSPYNCSATIPPSTDTSTAMATLSVASTSLSPSNTKDTSSRRCT